MVLLITIFELITVFFILASMGWALRAFYRFYIHTRKLMKARMESMTDEPSNPVMTKTTSGRMQGQPGLPGEEGEKLFEGITGGINWNLKSVILSTGRSQASRAWDAKSVWKTSDIRWPDGKFLMIMSTPSPIKTGNIKNTGFLNKVIMFAADTAIDIYVSGYFGNEYTKLVGMENFGTIMNNDRLKDFFILTNLGILAEKFLDDASLNAISSWKQHRMGFRQESKVDQFGVLFAPDAMLVSCQAALREPEEVKLFSDFASAMAVKMKAVLG